MLSQELLSNKNPNIKLEAIPLRCCSLRMSKKYLNPSRLLLFPLVVSWKLKVSFDVYSSDTRTQKKEDLSWI